MLPLFNKFSQKAIKIARLVCNREVLRKMPDILSRKIKFLIRVLQHRLRRDLCFLRASSLTYHSLLATVPILAVMFGIAKGFGLEQNIEQMLKEEFHEQQEVIQYLIQFGYSLLHETRGGVIAGVGVMVLLFTVGRLMSNIEASLNHMWGVPNRRAFLRQATDYLAFILICPILFALSSSLTVFISTQLQDMTEASTWKRTIGPFLLDCISYFPYLTTSLLFSFLYIIMPNKRVRYPSAAVAGCASAICFQLLQAKYISIQLGITRYGAIYGSFAALPLFLVWMYLSWLIFLFGAEVAVVVQERLWKESYLGTTQELTPFQKESAYIALVQCACENFTEGRTLKLREAAQKVGIPEHILSSLFKDLVHAGFLIESSSHEMYSLVQDAREYTVEGVLLKVETRTLSQRMAPKLYGAAASLIEKTKHQKEERILNS